MMNRCRYCWMTFKTSKKTLIHQRFHVKFKPYACDICSINFPQFEDLWKHNLRHLCTKPYKCGLFSCKKSFSSKVLLENHHITHIQEKHFVCKMCKKEFFECEALIRHGVKKHKRFPRRCEFLRQTKFHDHLRKLKFYPCDRCNKKFVGRQMLKRHKEKKHTFIDLTGEEVVQENEFGDEKEQTGVQVAQQERRRRSRRSVAMQNKGNIKQEKWSSVTLHEDDTTAYKRQKLRADVPNTPYYIDIDLTADDAKENVAGSDTAHEQRRRSLRKLVTVENKPRCKGKDKPGSTVDKVDLTSDAEGDCAMPQSKRKCPAKARKKHGDSHINLNTDGEQLDISPAVVLGKSSGSAGKTDANRRQSARKLAAVQYQQGCLDKAGSSREGLIPNMQDAEEVVEETSKKKLGRRRIGLITNVERVSLVQNVSTRRQNMANNVQVKPSQRNTFPSLQCNTCKRVFGDIEELKDHHLAEHKKHFCQICMKAFTNKQTLKYHQAKVHELHLQVPCSCSEKESSVEGKHVCQKHQSGYHTCNYCPKFFRSPADLQMHERVHTGDRPFPCGVCGKSFRQKCGLKVHSKRIHHEISTSML